MWEGGSNLFGPWAADWTLWLMAPLWKKYLGKITAKQKWFKQKTHYLLQAAEESKTPIITKTSGGGQQRNPGCLQTSRKQESSTGEKKGANKILWYDRNLILPSYRPGFVLTGDSGGKDTFLRHVLICHHLSEGSLFSWRKDHLRHTWWSIPGQGWSRIKPL